MKIAPDQLDGQLAKRLAPVYLISGDEPRQIMEAADAVRAKAKAAGFSHRELLQVDGGFEWGRFAEARDSYSLFGEPRVIDLRLPAKPDKEGAAQLAAYAERPPHDAILVVTTAKLTSTDQKARWFQALDAMGVFVQIWPLEGEQLLRWLDSRLNQKGLLADRSGLLLLATRVEGNLLAAAQEIEKLHILHGAGKLDDRQIVSAVADSSRFDVFDLAEAVLRGHTARAYRVLHGLKAEGVAAPVVLWALARELRVLADASIPAPQGGSVAAAFAKHKVWDKRKAMLSVALQRLDRRAVQRGLELCARADRMAKGALKGDPWGALLDICLDLTAGSKGFSPAALGLRLQ